MSEYIPIDRSKEVLKMQEEIYKHGEDPRANYPNLFQDIIDFHKHYGLEGSAKPRPMISYNLQNARIIHMHEELHEYMKSVQKDDMLNALDALVDLVYVALGTAYFHGFDFNEAWRRVHEANMRKVRVDAAENSKRGTKFDVVKPEGWIGPDLEDLV